MRQPTITVLLWLSGALALSLFATMVVHSQPLVPGIPALQLTFDEASFKLILAHWGSSGIERFHEHLRFDFLVLASYGWFGYLFVRHGCLFRPLDRSIRQLSAWTMPAAALLDAVENIVHLHLISVPDSHEAWLYLASGMIATGKWLLIIIFVAGTLCLLAIKGLHRRKPSA